MTTASSATPVSRSLKKIIPDNKPEADKLKYTGSPARASRISSHAGKLGAAVVGARHRQGRQGGTVQCEASEQERPVLPPRGGVVVSRRSGVVMKRLNAGLSRIVTERHRRVRFALAAGATSTTFSMRLTKSPAHSSIWLR